MPALRSQKNRPLQIQEPARSKRRGNEDDHEVWLAKKLKGKYPPLTNHSKSAVDAQRGKVYFYGGYRPEDKREIPTSDFRVFDINTMEFVDLTVRVILPGLSSRKILMLLQFRPLFHRLHLQMRTWT